MDEAQAAPAPDDGGMRLAALLLAIALPACADLAAGGTVVPPPSAATPPPMGGGGGFVDPYDPGAPNRYPGERISAAACPVDFADALAQAIAAVDDRPAHDALEVQRLNLERLGGASFSARLGAVSRLQALAQRLAAHGELAPDQAARIADLAPCWLE